MPTRHSKNNIFLFPIVDWINKYNRKPALSSPLDLFNAEKPKDNDDFQIFPHDTWYIP